jgi:hypothetical protein
MAASMKKLTVSILLCGLCYGSLSWADDKSEGPDGQARVRFFGQAVIGLTYYENKTCYGGDGIEASKTGLGGVFSSKKNVSLGIAETPNVVNLKQRDGILANAFFREYSVKAGEPITISAYLYESTGRTAYSCPQMNVYFIPGAKNDYEIALDTANKICRLNVMQLESTETGVRLLPVELSTAKKCLDKGN